MPKRPPQLRDSKKNESEQEFDRRKVFYGRVSTLEQNLDVQIAYADRMGVHPDNRFVEKISAKANRRPQFELMKKFLQPGDTLYVWSISRLARDTMQLLQINQDLMDQGVALVSGSEQIDARTPMGKLLITLFAMLAQFERDMAVERTREGLRARVEAGHQLGAKPKLTKEQIKLARRDLAKEHATVAEVALKYGVTPSTLTKWTGGKAKALRAAKRKGK